MASVIDELLWQSHKRTRALFGGDFDVVAPEFPTSQKAKLDQKVQDEYALVKDMPQVAGPSRGAQGAQTPIPTVATTTGNTAPLALTGPSESGAASTSLISYQAPSKSGPGVSTSLIKAKKAPAIQPEWHAPWKLMRVISGHLGWVRSVAVDPTNDWFATGAADRTIKIWDLASGTLRLTLTGHINTIRGLAVSDRHPYLFSAGDDKMVRCWDLEQNKTVRHFHGHLSGVYCVAVHPTLDLVVTGGRDSVARVWDMRRQTQIFCLEGHTQTVWSLGVQSTDPQVVTGSSDATVKLWDLAAGKCMSTLTHHKKGVRAIAMHPTQHAMVTASSDNIKQWRFPEAQFMQNFSGHNAVINSLSVNRDGVMVSGGDNGSMRFWDWRSGHCFQEELTRAQPGSLDAEAGILCSSFDMTGSRLITGEADKTIKIWKEDETATPETHPIVFNDKKKDRY